jgi:hypothetical protein
MEPLINPEQIEIYDFLKKFPRQFVSVVEVSKHVGNRKRFKEDRNWARPVLRRMEMEGWLESNSFGEYRLQCRPEDTTTFKKAISMPGVELGDTAIILHSDEDEEEKQENTSDTSDLFKRSAP